jgi:LuxR family maltose regulon positive regulatory protein
MSSLPAAPGARRCRWPSGWHGCGDLELGDEALADAADEAAESRSDLTSSVALAERALVAIHLGRWSLAEELSAQAARLVPDSSKAFATVGLASVAAASLAIHRGDAEGATAELRRTEDALAYLTNALPTFSAQVRLEAARTYLALEEADRARVLLDEAETVLRRSPGLGKLAEEVVEVRGQVDARREASVRLTAAEHRLLPVLATHLSFRDIGEQLYLSQHTVKAEAVSIYRKLGQSSRNGAITRARELGLLRS